MTQHRDIAPEVLSAIAYHEAGHAVANVLAYRNAQSRTASRCCRASNTPVTCTRKGKVGGLCFGSKVYRAEYAVQAPHWRWQDAMQWQIVIDMAGGAAEAIHRGERNKRGLMWFALLNCGTDGDLEDADKVLADLNALTGKRYGLNRFVIRAVELLRANWGAVEAIAAVMIRDGHIDGAEITAVVTP